MLNYARGNQQCVNSPCADISLPLSQPISTWPIIRALQYSVADHRGYSIIDMTIWFFITLRSSTGDALYNIVHVGIQAEDASPILAKTLLLPAHLTFCWRAWFRIISVLELHMISSHFFLLSLAKASPFGWSRAQFRLLFMLVPYLAAIKLALKMRFLYRGSHYDFPWEIGTVNGSWAHLEKK